MSAVAATAQSTESVWWMIGQALSTSNHRATAQLAQRYSAGSRAAWRSESVGSNQYGRLLNRPSIMPAARGKATGRLKGTHAPSPG